MSIEWETSFWDFCLERESIRRKKELYNEQRPWTNDKVLHKYKFTNLNRNHDRGTKRLFEICSKLKSVDEIVYLTLAYRISGSNMSLLNYLAKKTFNTWFEDIKDLNPLFRVDCYQAVWPKGEGKGIEFLTEVLPKFYLEVLTALANMTHEVHSLKEPKLKTLKQASKIISECFVPFGYNRLKFQSAECAKDFSELTLNIIDKDSYCELGPGSYSMLQIMYPRLRRKEAMEKLISHHRNKEFNFNYAVLEHALCEFNKYSYILGGRIPGKSKLYRNNS